MKVASTLTALAAAAALSGCNLPVIDKASDATARSFFDEVRSGADLAADPHVDRSLETPAAAAGFAAIRSLLPPGAPTKVNNTGYNFNTGAGTGSSARLSHQYVYGDRSITIQTVMRKPPGGSAWFVIGMEADLGGAQAPIVVGAPPALEQSSD